MNEDTAPVDRPIDPVTSPPLSGDYQWVTAPPPRVKFQHRYRTHVVLFLLTLFTITYRDAFEYLLLWLAGGFVTGAPNPVAVFLAPAVVYPGLLFSLPLLVILTAHEFGHYFACRRYDVDATLPYYLPLPLPPTGTLGAVIRIREPFPSKKALFDIGIAGPIAGFVALLPFLYWGLTLSNVGPVQNLKGAFEFGEPLLFKAFAWLRFGPIPAQGEVYAHPVAMAAWWGMLVTAINLMPFGQLDGGHIAYAVFGRPAKWLSVLTLVALLVLTSISINWFMMAALLLAMAFFLGFRHPRVPDEDAPLDRGRALLALFGLLIFIVCFTPVPIRQILG